MGGRDFEDLELYRLAREFRKAIYDLTDQLPADERFNLVSQMRRAALSITNNIAEGHGTYTFKQNIGYLHRARGSIHELRDDLNLCDDQSYIEAQRLSELRSAATRLTQVLNGYVRYLRTRGPRPSEAGEPSTS
ncbi:MAG TPA: four helix bundle protein [Phycisphaerae bacterium]|nr:four helix bundle protein [Phycisphaerae bacterium]